MRCFFVHETSGSVLILMSPSSLSGAPSGLGRRTATAHVETPRIITPSSTAWPPTGASRRLWSPSWAGRVWARSSLMWSCYRRPGGGPQALLAGKAQRVVLLVGLGDRVLGVHDRAHAVAR